MSEKYRLIKHNKNLAEIENDRGVGLLFLVDEDCERKLRIIVDCLNGQQATIKSLKEENEELQKENFSMKDEQNEMIAHLRKENEKIIENKCIDCELVSLQTRKIDSLEKENEQLRKKLECCEYSHFLNELDEIHEKVDKGDLSDFKLLKEDKPLNDYNSLKEDLYYWQCKYFRRDYEHKRDMCTRCNYGGLLNYCLKDKCDKMVKKNYEVIHFDDDGVSIGWKKGVDEHYE